MNSHTKYRRRGTGSALCAALLLLVCGSVSVQAQEQWTGSWSAAQMPVCDTSQLPKTSLRGATLLQVVHLSLGGAAVRLRLSNAFGDRPLRLHAITVERKTASADVGSNHASTAVAVQFNHNSSVAIPAGAEHVSDAIALPVDALVDLAVTMTIDDTPTCATSHPGARATSFLRTSGDSNSTPESFAHWYFLSGVEVESAQTAVAVLGDSITDGRGSTDDANNRWTDVLARRLAPLRIGVLNLGIGGNRVLSDGLGPSALARFDRDVLGASGVHTLIVFEGINDIGNLDREQEHAQAEHNALVDALEQAFAQMTARAHAHHMRVLGATLTPFVGSEYYHPGPRTEADRQRLNHWIRTTGIFDGIVDFDALLRDPAQPDHLRPEADSGDHLHPGPAGYQSMGQAVPLELLQH
jgi:lysophospholipase L1-like esterase